MTYTKEWFAKRFEEVLKEKNLTVYQLEKISGINRATLSHIANGKTEPKVFTFKRILAALNISEQVFWEGHVEAQNGRADITEKQAYLLEQTYHCNGHQIDRVIAYTQGILDQKAP